MSALRARFCGSASRKFREIYNKGPNLITRSVMGLDYVSPTRIVELSTGRGIENQPIYGVTVVDLVDGVPVRRDDLGQLFSKLAVAESYIELLGNPEIENPRDFCPRCHAEIELSDGGDGHYYVYCPRCGGHSDLRKLLDSAGVNVLGYPPHTQLD